MRTQPVFGSERSYCRSDEYDDDGFYMPRVIRETEQPIAVDTSVQTDPQPPAQAVKQQPAVPQRWLDFLYSGSYQGSSYGPSSGGYCLAASTPASVPTAPKKPKSQMDIQQTMDLMNSMAAQTSPMGGMMGMALDPMQMVLGVGFFCLVALGCGGVIMHNKRSQEASRVFLEQQRRKKSRRRRSSNSSCSTCYSY